MHLWDLLWVLASLYFFITLNWIASVKNLWFKLKVVFIVFGEVAEYLFDLITYFGSVFNHTFFKLLLIDLIKIFEKKICQFHFFEHDDFTLFNAWTFDFQKNFNLLIFFDDVLLELFFLSYELTQNDSLFEYLVQKQFPFGLEFIKCPFKTIAFLMTWLEGSKIFLLEKFRVFSRQIMQTGIVVIIFAEKLHLLFKRMK